MEVNSPINENQSSEFNQESYQEEVKQKGYLLPILGVIILILVVGAGAYYFGIQKKSTPSSGQKVDTYVNNQYSNWREIELNKGEKSLRFKMPPDWGYTRCVGDDGKEEGVIFLHAGSNRDQKDINHSCDFGPPGSISVSIESEFSKLSSFEEIESYQKKSEVEVRDGKQIMIGKETAFTWQEKFLEDPLQIPFIWRTQAYIPSKQVEIELADEPNFDEASAFGKIIESFEFKY